MKRIPIIILCALLSVLGLMLLVRGFDMKKEYAKYITIEKKGNIFNLKNEISLENTKVLLGEHLDYYPSAFIMPDKIEQETPLKANRSDELNADYYTQRFQIEVSDDTVYVLTVDLAFRHALRVYVNGELAGQIGVVGEKKETTQPGEDNLTFLATPKDGKIDVVIHAAQFYHFENRATLPNLYIQQSVSGLEKLDDTESGLIVVGILFGVATILFFMFIMYPGAKSTLYFTFACLAMILREVETSQIWTQFPFISSSISFMLEYLSLVILSICLTLYLGYKIDDMILRITKAVMLFCSIIYGIMLLFCDSIFYTSMLKYYQIVLVVGIICGIGRIFWKMRRPNTEQAISFYGIAVFFIAAITDILMYNNILGDISKVSVSEVAMLVFVLMQTISLFMMNSRLITEATAEKEIMERSNRLKTEFLGNISHELKTPLTVMSSYSQIIRKKLMLNPDYETQCHHLKLIESEAERLSLMVAQILDVTRIEEDKLILNIQPCSLNSIVNKTLDTYYPVFGKNRNELIFVPNEEDIQVICDANRIIQVLVNLISNAAHHTQNGIIMVKILKEQEFAVLEVSDTGKGMDTEQVRHIFERYYSSQENEKPGNGRNTGTGLGLYICKHIVTSHGGDIIVQSEVGVGTTFKVTLPYS